MRGVTEGVGGHDAGEGTNTNCTYGLGGARMAGAGYDMARCCWGNN